MSLLGLYLIFCGLPFLPYFKTLRRINLTFSNSETGPIVLSGLCRIYEK